MGETVAATIVYTDLVGSTALTTSVPAAEAERIRGEHFRLLGEAIATHGGREVKNLGDGVMAAFPGCSAALDAATAMQQAIVRHNRVDAGPELSIRIGISTGDCIAEDGDFFGEPSIQAARLCDACEGGQILVASVVGLLVPRATYTLTSVGELELKGIPEPFAALELAWPPPALGSSGGGSPVPMPPRLAVPSGMSGLVGRRAERQQLTDAFKAAHAGERRVVLVTGEAGLGKTRLTAEFAAEAFDAGAIVLYGRCDEELSVPYLPWVESLGHLVENLDGDALAELDPAARQQLGRLLPQLRREAVDLLESNTADGDQYALFSSVRRLLEHVAAEQTLLVVLDDLHWADRGTLQPARGHLVASDPVDHRRHVPRHRSRDR